MRLKWIGLVTLLALAFWFFKPSAPQKMEASAPVVASDTPAPIESHAGVVAPTSPVNDLTKAPRKRYQMKSLEADSPRLDTIREEIAKNPHGLPPSIEKFAADLGEKMQRAMQSEPIAQKVFPELASCALDIPKSTYASTPRTLCYNDASRLAEKYPSLQENFAQIKRELDPETLKRFTKFEKVLQAP